MHALSLFLALKAKSDELIQHPGNELTQNLSQDGSDARDELNLELFPLFGTFELLSWFSLLAVADEMNRASQETEKAVVILEKSLDKLSNFQHFKYYADFWLIAALKLAVSKVTSGEVGYVLY